MTQSMDDQSRGRLKRAGSESPLAWAGDGARIPPTTRPSDAHAGDGTAGQAQDDVRAVERREFNRGVTRRGAELRLPWTDTLRPADMDGMVFAILEKLHRGVLVVERRGTVVFMNGAAETMLARKSGLLLRGRCLRFEASSAHAALERYLSDGCGTPDCTSLVLRVDGVRLKSPYRVLVTPLATAPSNRGGACLYGVFVYEPNGGQKPLPVAVLRHLYGLTAAEARLANALFAGKTLVQAAENFGVSVNTAKYTLKSIFSKCEVSSRAELLLLLSLGPRTL